MPSLVISLQSAAWKPERAFPSPSRASTVRSAVSGQRGFHESDALVVRGRAVFPHVPDADALPRAEKLRRMHQVIAAEAGSVEVSGWRRSQEGLASAQPLKVNPVVADRRVRLP